jgi:hypothetical protein
MNAPVERRPSRLTGRAPRPGQRVRVTSPRMGSAARPPVHPPTREIDEQTEVGEIYMRSLLRSQLHLALAVLGVVGLGLGSLPLLFAIEPRMAAVRVLSVPLPWLLLGVAVYPLLVGAAWWYVRVAERTERDFADVLGRR